MAADLAARDLVHMALGRGRDKAAPIGELAESLHLLRREVEAAVQALRLEGVPVASGRDGVWYADSAADMAATAQILRGRLISQYRTLRAVPGTTARLRAAQYQQTSMDLVA